VHLETPFWRATIPDSVRPPGGARVGPAHRSPPFASAIIRRRVNHAHRGPVWSTAIPKSVRPPGGARVGPAHRSPPFCIRHHAATGRPHSMGTRLAHHYPRKCPATRGSARWTGAPVPSLLHPPSRGNGSAAFNGGPFGAPLSPKVSGPPGKRALDRRTGPPPFASAITRQRVGRVQRGPVWSTTIPESVRPPGEARVGPAHRSPPFCIRHHAATGRPHSTGTRLAHHYPRKCPAPRGGARWTGAPVPPPFASAIIRIQRIRASISTTPKSARARPGPALVMNYLPS